MGVEINNFKGLCIELIHKKYINIYTNTEVNLIFNNKN
jgi:hypothetical protein